MGGPKCRDPECTFPAQFDSIYCTLHALAMQLNSKGPDEYPWGYYVHLASRILESKKEKAHDS